MAELVLEAGWIRWPVGRGWLLGTIIAKTLQVDLLRLIRLAPAVLVVSLRAQLLHVAT